MKKFLKVLLDAVASILLIVLGIVAVATLMFCIYMGNFSELAQHERVLVIYNKLLAKIGQNQDHPTLVIAEDSRINAYTDGYNVVVFQGILDYTKNDDEIALILGHELGHNTLRHISFPGHSMNLLETTTSEANADKIGAFYMMRAGYDICKGREFWKRMYEEQGTSLGLDHPDVPYRYMELNINCE